MRIITTLITALKVLWQYARIPLRFLRRHLKKSIAVFVFLLVSWISFAVSRPKPPEYVTAQARRGELRQLVEAVGTVTSEKDLELQFPVLDVVSSVLVREGMTVKAGQKLATLRSGTLSASVAAASANVQSADAALRALQEGARPEDIAIVEAQVMNKQAALTSAKQTLLNAEANLVTAESQLETLRSEARVSLSGYVGTANSASSQQLAAAKTALLAVRGVFDANDVQDSIVKSLASGYDTLQANISATLSKLTTLQSAATATDYQTALRVLTDARSALWTTADIVSRAYDTVSSLTLTSYFTSTSRETNKTTIATQKTTIQAAVSSIETALKTLQDASAGYDTRIAASQAEITSLKGTRDKAKADIATYETSLAIDQAQLALRKAPARQTDIDAAQARVRQAKADLSRAASQLRDTILTAPVDGVITNVSVKPGEMRPSAQASITMLGQTPLRIEMFVSEVDIPKVALFQTGAIVLDAFPGRMIPIRVSEIDSASTDKDGVPKYRIKLDFIVIPEGLKVGMTGDGEITTGRREDVISVPLRAIIEKGTGAYVRVQKNGEIIERTVTVGMEGDGGDTEVTGVQEGETIIVLEKK